MRRVNNELMQKSSTRRTRIEELEASIGALTAKTSEAEARIKALTIDGPVDELCSQISVAPQALRTALEADYKIELDKNGALTLLNRTDNKPVTDKDGKQLLLEPDAIRNLLLGTKDEAKVKLYRAIVVTSKASGGAPSTTRTISNPPTAKPQFGLGVKVR